MDRRKFLVSSLLSSLAASTLSDTSVASPNTVSPEEHSKREAEALARKLMHDPLRPQYHLLPIANWMNDPCAPRFHRGQYHIFFQYNPGAAVWGDMHWAHATSPDMIHWKHLPVALSPTAGSADAYGCFTGSVLPGMATATILYTGVTKCTPEQATARGGDILERQCIATSADDDLHSWTKGERPVIAAPPPGMKVTGFRDPCPWKDGDTWYLILGSGFTNIGGAVLLYRSHDGRTWEYLHHLAQGKWSGNTSKPDPVDSGEMWECPDFFPLGDKHVLLYSTERKVYWEVGVFDKQHLVFRAESRGLLDHGHYYAMKSMLDEQGRRILWGWITEARSDEELKQAGWAGAMALPRVLSLGMGNQLRMTVPPEFSSLQYAAKTVAAGKERAALSSALAKMPIMQRAGALVCSFKTVGAACGFELRAGGELLLDAKIDGIQPFLVIADQKLALAPDSSGLSTIRLWIDGSIIEVFVDDQEAITTRCYGGAGDVAFVWTGASDMLADLTVSQVKPISSNRLST